MTDAKIIRYGAHLSTQGGLDQAIIRAHQIGANCVQVFSGSPRMWRRTPLSQIAQTEAWSAQEKLDVKPIFTHALYLVNLASDNPDLRRKSASSLIHDLSFDAHVKGSGVIVHLGSHQGRGWAAVQEQVLAELISILEQTPVTSRLLIENAASTKGKIGGDLAEIAWLLHALTQKKRTKSLISADRIGWCLDTCHAFAAGYWLGSAASWQNWLTSSSPALLSEPPRFLQTEIQDLDLIKWLKCAHINDSRDPFASGRDRHDNLFTGTIPPETLRSIVAWLGETVQVPCITEVPGMEGGGPDAENMKRLISCFSPV